MSRRLTRAVIGSGIMLSLLGWGAGRMGEITLDTLGPTIPSARVATPKIAMPRFTVQLSIEVRP